MTIKFKSKFAPNATYQSNFLKIDSSFFCVTFQPNQPSRSIAPSKPEPAASKPEPESQLSSQEIEFDAMFKNWEIQFQEWKNQNMNNPDTVKEIHCRISDCWMASEYIEGLEY